VPGCLNSSAGCIVRRGRALSTKKRFFCGNRPVADEDRSVDHSPDIHSGSDEDILIQKREVIQVLNRTWEDRAFWVDLMEQGSRALADYRLSSEAKAAITSGDLKWINENIGELTQKQLLFIYKRLEREAW